MSTTRLVGFGASTAQGAVDPEGGFLSRVQRLADAESYPLEVINRGIGGNSTPHMLARVDALAELRPYDLLVVLGCNDLPRANDGNAHNRTTLPDYTRNLEALFPAIKGGGRCLFISSYPICEVRRGMDPKVFRQYMEAALSVARANGYEIWDLHAEILASGVDYLSEDGLHYGAEGHAYLAERAYAWVKSEPL